MKVKIGNKWFDSNDTPIAIKFEDHELECVKGMNKEVAPRNKFVVGRNSQVDGGDLLAWSREGEE